MPTTPNGVPYTTTTINLGAPHGVMHITAPDWVTPETPVRMALYFHGSTGRSDQFVDTPAWGPMLNALMDDMVHPWIIVEGSGGSALGPSNWGNDAALAAYPAYENRGKSDYNVTDVLLLGRSMGCLPALNLYAHDTTGRYAGLISSSGVSTLFVGLTDGSGTSSQKSTGRHFGSAVWEAYGETTYEGFAVAAADYAPESWDASLWAGKKILSCYGTADYSVPWYPRGGSALRDVWAGQPEIDRVAVRIGGDHGQANGSYHQVDDMLLFIADVFGDEPPRPPAATYLEVAELHLLDQWGRRHELHI